LHLGANETQNHHHIPWQYYDSQLNPGGSVTNSCGPSLSVRILVQTEMLPNWQSRSSIQPNCQVGYGSIVNSHLSEWGMLSEGRLACPSIDSYQALVFAVSY
jgi:hypothetical protein